MLKRILILLALLIAFIPIVTARAEVQSISDPNFPLISLPSDFEAHRATGRVDLQQNESMTILDVEGPGAVRHFWITVNDGDGLIIEITTDGAEKSQVQMPLHQFFGVMLGQAPYRIESAAIKLLPKNGYNSYLPIPFQRSCRITLRNTLDSKKAVWAMANWHRYNTNVKLTPFRLHAVHREEKPAAPFGSYLLADVTGRGFIAGFFKGIRRQDHADIIYHTGGDLWLIDGETNPHVIRGIGVEDVFGYSFGYTQDNSQWTGCPYVKGGTGPTVTEGVTYRFFGIDMVPFKSSLVLRFGSRANDIESVVYYYLDETASAAAVHTPDTWTLAGPFDCQSITDFEQGEFPEQPVSTWPATWEWGKRTLSPVTEHPEHTFIDFTRHFRKNAGGNTGTQSVDVSAYARTTIQSDSRRDVRFRVGFDDWMTLWINGKEVGTFRHDNGFAVTDIPLTLAPGENTVLIKLSNFDNIEWRCWAFSCKIIDEK